LRIHRREDRAFPDDDDPFHQDRQKGLEHGRDRDAVRCVLVAPAHPGRRRDRRRLGRPDEADSEAAVGGLGKRLRHPTRRPGRGM